MKLDQQMAELIYKLEYIIGDSCYNPNSYDGYTGEEGREYRYPVKIYEPSWGHMWKTRSHIENIPAEHIQTMRYEFGSNHLFIGKALIRLLSTLENRYGLDFNKLEEKYQESQKTK